MAAEGTLLAGVGRTVITPPRGTHLVGYAERWRGCTGVHDDLFATALALSDGAVRIVLVACDLLCIHEDTIDRVREAVGAGTAVVISCSHTHAGPITYAGPKAPRARREYIDLLVSRIADAIRGALADLGPARLQWAEGDASIGVNRREKTAEGKVILGWNRDGPADKSIGILRVTRPDETPVATVVNYACHGTILPPQNLHVSADWVGAMRRRVEAEIGGLVLFLQGAAGDINPDYEWGEGDPWKAVERLGASVAASVAGAVRALSNADGPALSNVEGRGPPVSGVPLDITRREILLPFEPTPDERLGVRWLDTALGSRRLDAADAGTPGTGEQMRRIPPRTYRKKVLEFAGVPAFFSFLTDRLLDRLYPWWPRLEFKDGAWFVPMRLNAVRIGDVGLVTFGAEVFTEIGLRIKAACAAKHAMFASLSDGCIGYLPTAAAHNEGGYEVDDGPYLYRYPGRLAPECEQIATEAANEMVCRLF
jgi:hypothetical protein